MVYYEHDKLDENKEDVFTHFGECLMTMYTGKVIHVTAGSFHKKAKKYFVDCANGRELCFRKSAVILIEVI